MQTDFKEIHHLRENRVVKILPNIRKRNQAISRIANEFHYIESTANVLDLFEDLSSNGYINAVGVVDKNMNALGIIVKEEFFSFLSRPYARDVMKNRTVAEVMTKAELFNCDLNLFTVAEEIHARLRKKDIAFFVLTDDNNKFQGIFSTRSMLVYLSEITQNDIALARKMQTRLVKDSNLVAGKTFEFISTSLSAKGVGGDFYSIKNYTENKWIITVCDVSGKGIAASIITSVMWGMMYLFDFRTGMKTFIEKLNNYLVHTFESEKFITGIFIDFDEQKQELVICDMGHSHIFVMRNNKLLKLTSKQKNIPIGVLSNMKPELNIFKPEKNDIIFILTDGLIEQESMDGKIYSFKRISSILKTNSEKPVEYIRDAILTDFNSFKGSHHLNDDVTFALIKFIDQDVTL
jgi:sigma-B regulation protein RsbU (phosphoserine phosphatase)